MCQVNPCCLYCVCRKRHSWKKLRNSGTDEVAVLITLLWVDDQVTLDRRLFRAASVSYPSSDEGTTNEEFRSLRLIGCGHPNVKH